MKAFLNLFIFVSFLTSCNQGKKSIAGETDFQRTLNAEFKDATKSPLKNKDRKVFEGLEFFPFDSTYVVIANLVRTPDTDFFNMKTTTDRVTRERVYGILTFELKGKKHKLNIYQSEDTEIGLENYLFLPFLDQTNGIDTYGGGRYLDASIPEGNSMEIDFNKAYNPSCAYNEAFSCPIVPRENYLETRIEAGVKAFQKH